MCGVMCCMYFLFLLSRVGMTHYQKSDYLYIADILRICMLICDIVTHLFFLQILATDLEALSKLEVLDLSGSASSLPEPSAVSKLPHLKELYLRL